VIKLDTVLFWDLEARDGGTEVLLEHKGFKGFHNYLASIFMGSGWQKRDHRAFTRVLNDYVQNKDLPNKVPAIVK